MAEHDDDLQRRADFIRGLRECADFIERNPLIPTPYSQDVNAFVNSREELAAVARSGAWGKDYSDDYFWLIRTFSGNVTVQVNTRREQVCRRVVIGSKVIPAQSERTVDEVEWICDDPLLSAEPVRAPETSEASEVA